VSGIGHKLLGEVGPTCGQSSRQAAARLQEFLAGLRVLPGRVAAVTHGGITVELLRDLLGDDALPPKSCRSVSRHAPSPPTQWTRHHAAGPDVFGILRTHGAA
jgi:hypothetical protein